MDWEEHHHPRSSSAEYQLGQQRCLAKEVDKRLQRAALDSYNQLEEVDQDHNLVLEVLDHMAPTKVDYQELDHMEVDRQQMDHLEEDLLEEMTHLEEEYLEDLEAMEDLAMTLQ